MVAACAEIMRAQAKSKRIAAALIFVMLVRLSTACEVPAFKGDVVVTFANHPTYAVAFATAPGPGVRQFHARERDGYCAIESYGAGAGVKRGGDASSSMKPRLTPPRPYKRP